jgi:hypothetical protein
MTSQTLAEQSIRSLFQTRRPIDRPIEKVIDYYVTDDARLRAEIEEYEVTENVERNFQRFLDVFGAGVRGGQVAETGIWVSGFYGSGKSSFTKYLGFALDPDRNVGDRRFLDLLSERLNSPNVRAELRTLSTREPVAVVMLDLGSEQLASSASATVSNVLYWKVLQLAGYSREEKLASLELRLEQDDKLEAFRREYARQFPGSSWDEVHDDPLRGVARADQLVSRFYPADYPEPGVFRSLRFSLAIDVREQARQMIELIRRRTGRTNILFLVDEAGQYVAPRGELILNLDGLARNLKEIGHGRVWLVGTGQQTLSEIVQRAAYNSDELNKLRDRFPVSIELDARDIREITWRRLLSKSAEGEATLRDLFRTHGQSLVSNTRLSGSGLFKSEPDEASFAKLYPFLPQHFDVLLELIRTLARSTGGIGLRSAIRVIQDLLVDASHTLPAGTSLLANAAVGQIATADLFYDTLRADIAKSFPYVVAAVDRAQRVFVGNRLIVRIAKAVAALQPIDSFPRTAENVSALLYSDLGAPPNLDTVRDCLRQLVEAREVGLVDDPQSGGFAYLSEGVKPLRDKRNSDVPSTTELNLLKAELLKSLFDPLPQVTLLGTKTIRAGVRIGSRSPLAGDDEEVQIRLEFTDTASWDARRMELLGASVAQPEWRTNVAWVVQNEDSVDDLLVEILRSRHIGKQTSETEADRDISQFLRSERRLEETNSDRAAKEYRRLLSHGVMIFRGKPTPAAEAGATVDASARKVLQEAAADIYASYRLAPIRAQADLAARFLQVERLDRMPPDSDPLKFVTVTGGRAGVNANHDALAEVRRVLGEKLNAAGTGRIQGNALLELFATAPYGWSKDTTRYVFAGLLLAGEIEFHTATGIIKTSGPGAIEALRSTQGFGRVGVSLREARISREALDRAATRLEALFGVQVMPLEDHISRAVREHVPARMEELAPISGQLRLLGLPGDQRATGLYQTCADLLRDDGGSAVAVLGAPECTIPEDLNWARLVARALASGAEQVVRAARTALSESDELTSLFPNVEALLSVEERAELDEILGSDHFFERLADLRSLTGRAEERAAHAYRTRFELYTAELESAKRRIEAHEGWPRLEPDDQQDLAGRLVAAAPPSPRDHKEIADLQTLLVRRGMMPALEQEIVREIARRQPITPVIADDGTSQEPRGEREHKLEDVIDIVELVPGMVISTDSELEGWLARLRGQLGSRLPVRIEVGRQG